NGEGGFYIPIPQGFRFREEMEELISEYPQYDTLPTVSPPGSYNPLEVEDDVVYSVEDFTSLGKLATGHTVSDVSLLNKPNGDRYLIIIYRDGQIVIVNT